MQWWLLIAFLAVNADLAAALRTAVGAGGRAPQEPSWPADAWDDDLSFGGELGEEGLSMRRRAAQEAGLQVDPLRHILVYPPKKLAFCFIPKNACTNFNWLFARLNHNATPTWAVSSLRSFGLTVADVTQERGWKWAVFLRDPLLRYLSAWGSKCFQQEDGPGGNCIPRGITSETGSVEDFERHVIAMYRNQSLLATNQHWALQQDFCGGLNNAVGYDFVGQLHGDVNGQVRAMFRKFGVPEDDVDEFFPKHKIAQHKSRLDPQLYYRSPTISKRVHDMYRKDYDLPGL